VPFIKAALICLGAAFSSNAYAVSPGISLKIADDGILSTSCAVGDKSGNCLFDSGSSMSFVSENSSSLIFPKLSDARADSAEGTSAYVIVNASSFSIDKKITVVDLPVVRTNQYDGLPANLGVIGSDLLVGKDLIFDFLSAYGSDPQLFVVTPENKGTFTDFSGAGKIYLPSKKIEIEITLAGVPVHALWDTHSTTLVSKKFRQDHPQLFTLGSQQKVTTVTGDSGQMNTYTVAGKFCFAGHCMDSKSPIGEIDGPVLASDTGSIDLVLGLEFLYNYSWYFDYDRQTYSVIDASAASP